MKPEGWFVHPMDDELLLEFWRDGTLAIIVSIEKDGLGYAIKDGAQFRPGRADPDEDFAGAMREIVDATVGPLPQ